MAKALSVKLWAFCSIPIKTKMFKNYLPAIGLLVLANSLNAQDKVLERTNRSMLETMVQEFNEQDAILRAKIEAYAKEHNVLIDHYLPSGKVVSIVGFDTDGKPLYQQTDNNSRAAATISTNRVYPSATVASKYNLAGRGFTVGEWDGGASRITHREFEGRSVQADNSTMALSEHATHVGGTLIAGGITANARGMAYQANLLANDWNNDDAEMTSRAAQGLLISNHSYGTQCGWEFNESTNQWEWNGNDAISTQYDYKFGYYDTQARDWDRISYNAPYYLIVKSAGNSRNSGPGNDPNRPNNGPYDCIPTYSVAKNILTVGAVVGLNNGYVNANGVVISDFSSWGPADDGRIKPDICGNGVSVYSTGSASDQQYVTLDGTSMSSPSVAGSCLLLQEMYSNTHNKGKMKAATLKGLVIHTADECFLYPGPDYRFGWGLMNTRKAADVILSENRTSLLDEDTLTNTSVKEYTVTAIGGATPLVATLCWTDYQGTPGPPALNSRVKMLVNDLDLRIINESNNQVTLPWRLNPDSVTAPARKNDNLVDNVEKVELPGATAGQTYKIRITHKGNLFAGTGNPQHQPYSLLISGVVAGDTTQTCLPIQWMNAKSGIVEDGSGSTRPYANNSDCGWVLNPEDSAAVVQVVFRNFNVASGDTLFAYSGTNASGTLIGKFSGNSLPDTIVSEDAQMYLNFKSDGSGNAAGWEIAYSSLPKPRFTFAGDAKTICAGGNVVYTVTPLNGPTTDWIYNWQLNGASVTTSTATSPTVVYPTQGTYSVTLSISNKAGQTTVVSNNIVTVKPVQAPLPAPYSSGFEETNLFTNPNTDLNWFTTTDANAWVRNTLSPYEGLAAMRIRNNTGLRNKRELISPAIDLSSGTGPYKIFFRTAYARISTATAADQLRVLISTDCGKTWTESFKRSHTTNPPLSTIGNTASDIVSGTFIPELSQYRLDSISLASLPANTTNLLVNFEMTSERGNFLYLDNFRVAGVTSVADENRAKDLSVLVIPNPSESNATIRVQTDQAGSTSIKVTDLTGRVHYADRVQIYNNSGETEISTASWASGLRSGVYLIQVSNGVKTKTVRWFKN